MKGFHLKSMTYSDVLEWSHGFGTLQNAVYVPERGIFGLDKRYFFTDNPKSMAECQKVVDERNKHFIGEVELDSSKVDELIALGKNYNSARESFDEKAHSILEQIVKTDEEKLEEEFKITAVKLAKPVDLATLPKETIERLERIVESCKNDRIKAEFYMRTGNKENAAKYGKETIACDSRDFYIDKEEAEVTEHHNIYSPILNFFNKLFPRKVGVYHNMDSFMKRLENSEKYNLDDKEKKRIAKDAYEFAMKERKYDTAADIGKRFLELPEEEIRKLQGFNLFKDMITNWADDEEGGSMTYSEIVNHATKELPQENVKSVAFSAYMHLINNKPFADGIEYLRAGKLAQMYELGRDKVLKAGEKIIKMHEKRNWGFKKLECAIKELELPYEMAKPVILIYFQRNLSYFNNKSEIIRKKYNLNDEEIKPLAQREYDRIFKFGGFAYMFNIRKKCPSLIEDNKISFNDLEILAGMDSFRL